MILRFLTKIRKIYQYYFCLCYRKNCRYHCEYLSRANKVLQKDESKLRSKNNSMCFVNSIPLW